MKQRGLWDPALTAARATDPASSHAAADRMAETGAAEGQRSRVLEALRGQPGRTLAELMVQGLDRYQVARRLPELVTLGLVRRGAARECQVTGRQAVTWWVAG